MVHQMIILAFSALRLQGKGDLPSSFWLVDSGASNHMTSSSDCSDPRARSDPNGESEPKPGDARLILFIYILFRLLFFFQKCRDPNPRLAPFGGSEPEPGLLRRFQLSYQNIFFMLFLFRFSICAEAFSNGRPTIIHISQNVITMKAFYPLSK